MTGSEADHAALRLARAATGRAKVIRFSGHYHGWLDSMLIDQTSPTLRPGTPGQPPGALDDIILLPWDDLAALEAALDASPTDVAAVIMEPVMFNAGARLAGPDYLLSVRELCSRHGVVLIFDEVITGFRLALGGAAARFGVKPDLAVYGKAVAGGWPVAVLAGRAGLMDLLGGPVNHSGTFNGSLMACAATIATLEVLNANPPYEGMSRFGMALMDGLRSAGDAAGVPLRIEGLPVAFHLAPVNFGENARAGATALQFSRLLADFGLWTTTRGIWFVSATHGDAELDWTLDRFTKALGTALSSGMVAP